MTESTPVGSGDRLSFTVFLALAVHALVIFGISFKINSGQKVAPTLNITLATHKSKVEPEKADFLAQFDQQASGTSEKVKELSTLKQAKIADIDIQDITPLEQQRATDATRKDIQLLSSTTTQERKTYKPKKTNMQEETEAKTGDNEDTPWVNPEIASLKAKLDRLKEIEAKRPRMHRLTSVATKSSEDAMYLNNWAQKIETVGNNNFPEAALRDAIFGKLRLSVIIDPKGFVENIEILQSSGHPILDDSAIQIVKLASPFDRFPPAIKKNWDKMEIIRTWRFDITGLSTAK